MPSRLGRYAVRRRIGSGAFATVWLAYDEQLDSPVAIKVLAENWTEDQQVRQRFLEEGRFLRKVESPYVVSVYDAGELEDGRPYLVMSYADQGTLADRLEVEGLSPAQALEVVRQVGAGLQALHVRGVLHRDVKPANVLFRTVDDQVRAMVADLGLGKALDMSSRLTMIAGTPSFVAPEQAQGEPLDPRADQYSLAALTYLLLSGRAPYAHASLSAAAAPRRTATAVHPRPSVPGRRRGGGPPGAGSRPRGPVARRRVVRRCARRRPRAGCRDRPERAVAAGRPAAHPAGRTAELAAVGRTRCRTRCGRARSRRRVVAAGARAGRAHGVAVRRRVRGLAAGPRRADGERRHRNAERHGAVRLGPDRRRRLAAAGARRPTTRRCRSAPRRTGPSDDGAEGVFVGLLPGTDLPAQVPQHPECATADEPVTGTTDGADSVTVVYRDCPDGVVVERVVQLTANRMLWVQVRSDDTATAYRVLDDVEAHGFG